MNACRTARVREVARGLPTALEGLHWYTKINAGVGGTLHAGFAWSLLPSSNVRCAFPPGRPAYGYRHPPIAIRFFVSLPPRCMVGATQGRVRVEAGGK